jgi:hypothetical protein
MPAREKPAITEMKPSLRRALRYRNATRRSNALIMLPYAIAFGRIARYRPDPAPILTGNAARKRLSG